MCVNAECTKLMTLGRCFIAPPPHQALLAAAPARVCYGHHHHPLQKPRSLLHCERTNPFSPPNQREQNKTLVSPGAVSVDESYWHEVDESSVFTGVRITARRGKCAAGADAGGESNGAAATGSTQERALAARASRRDKRTGEGGGWRRALFLLIGLLQGNALSSF